MDAFDRVEMLKNIFAQSKSVQNIIASARAEASVYLIANPDEVIFSHEGRIIDPLYEDIFERAEKRIQELVSSVRKRRAARMAVMRR